MANKKRDEPVEEVEWEVKEILAENVKKKLLKISWEGTDSNGKPWAPTWEPYSCASAFLLREWEDKKKAQSEHAHRRSSKAALQNADIIRNKSRSRSRSSSSSSDGSSRHKRSQRSEDATQSIQEASPVPVVEINVKKRKRPTSVVYPGVESGSSYVPTSQSQATTNTSATQNSTNTDSNSHDIESAEVRALMGPPLFLPTSRDDDQTNESSISIQAKPKKKRKVSFGTVSTKRHRDRNASDNAEEATGDAEYDSETVEKLPSSIPDPDNDDVDDHTGRLRSPEEEPAHGKGRGKLIRYNDKKEQERIANRQKNMARRDKLLQKKAEKRDRGEAVSTSEDEYALPANIGSSNGKKKRVSSSGARQGTKEPTKKTKSSDYERQSPPLRSLPSNLQPRTASTSRSTISDASTTSTDAFTALMEHATSEHAPSSKDQQRRNPGKQKERQPSLQQQQPQKASDTRTVAQKKADRTAREIVASASPERRSTSLSREGVASARAYSSKSDIPKASRASANLRDIGLAGDEANGRLPTFKKKPKPSTEEGPFVPAEADPAESLFRRNRDRVVDADAWPAVPSATNDEDDSLPNWDGQDDFQNNDFADEWPLPPPLAAGSLEDTSTVVVPDSQPGNNTSLRQQPSGGPSDQVRISRTLRRVAVPEPEAFRPYVQQRNDSRLTDPWNSQDTESIRQFSSQVSANEEHRLEWPVAAGNQRVQHSTSSRPHERYQQGTSLGNVGTSVTRPLSQIQRPRRPTVDQANIESPAEKRLRSKQLLQASAVESEEEVDDDNEHLHQDNDVGSEWLDFGSVDTEAQIGQGSSSQQVKDTAAVVPERKSPQSDDTPDHPSLPQQVLQASARAVQDASTMTDSVVGADAERPVQPIAQEQADDLVQAGTDAGPVVLETSKSLAMANNKLRGSTLLTDTDLKMEISILLEAPEYYAISGRALTMKPTWELELERDEDGNSWHIIIKPLETEWYLEKRQKPRPQLSTSGKSTNSAYAALSAQHEKLAESYATLQKSSDASILRIGALESDLNHLRGRQKQSAEEADRLTIENAKLKAEIQQLTQSVETGVRQVQLFVQAKEARLKEELARAQTALSVIQTMAKTADHDSIRQKAARTEELEARERLRLENAVYWPAVNPLAVPDAVAGTARVQAASVAALNAQYAEDDESEDEDFKAGSSSDGRSSSDDTSDEADLPSRPVQSIAPNVQSHPTMGVQGSVLQQPISVDLALRSVLDHAERALEQGPQSHETIPPLFDGMLQAIDPTTVAPAALISEPQVSVPVISVAEAMDTSGETTEVTATSSSHPLLTESQSQGSSGGGAPAGSHEPKAASSQQLETEDVLELDSALLDSQEGYQCQIGLAKGRLCGRLFDSQKSMYEHLQTDHQPTL